VSDVHLERLLDNGFAVILFRNQLDTYTACAVRADHDDVQLIVEDAEEDHHLAEHHTIPQLLPTLVDKVFAVGDYSPGPDIQ